MYDEDSLRAAVDNEFHSRLPNSNIPALIIQLAINNVVETSGISEGDGYSHGDVELAVTRTIVDALEAYYEVSHPGAFDKA